MTTQSRHLHRLLSLFDPLLCRPAFVVEAHHAPVGYLQVGHDESDSGEQLPEVELHFRHHTPRRLPARGLVEEALVPHHGAVARSSYGRRQQLRDVALQVVIGGDTKGIIYSGSLPCLGNLPAWQRRHRRETPLPYRVLVGAQFPAVTVLPSLPHYARCPDAASPRDSRPQR